MRQFSHRRIDEAPSKATSAELSNTSHFYFGDTLMIILRLYGRRHES